MIKILNGWLRTAFLVFDLASLDGCTMGEEAALGGGEGAIWSGTGRSGSDKDDRVSNLLDTSREASVSNNDVEKFGMPHRMHSHAMLLLNDL